MRKTNLERIAEVTYKDKNCTLSHYDNGYSDSHVDEYYDCDSCDYSSNSSNPKGKKPKKIGWTNWRILRKLFW